IRCGKTELLVIPSDSSPGQDLQITLHDSLLSPSATARNLGVTMDNELSFFPHIANVARSCRFLLYNIRRIRPFLSIQAAQMLVQSLVISRLDYCNSLLAGPPLNAIRPLQMIQNTAARLAFTSRTKPRCLRSSITARLVPPSLRRRGKYNSRLFSVLAPKWWNELPLDVRTAESLIIFKRRLKTYLF
ncbi:hypothetical protein C0J45_11356, partial [Silurus meridionalis]